MASKTKAQLEQEIKNSREQIECLELELEKANRVETKNDAAQELYEMYEAYTEAGFTEEQAWELMKIIVNNGTTKRGLF